MSAKSVFRSVINNLIMKPRLKVTESWEQMVCDYTGAMCGGENSPVRFYLPKELIRLEGDHDVLPGFPASLPEMIGCVVNTRKSVFELEENPNPGKKQIDTETLEELKVYARSVGASDLGFASVPQEWVFKDTAIRYTQAIVLTMEMDKARMDLAPHKDTAVMVFETYNGLGQVSNKVANWLRERGFAAHAGHPLGGMALYPPVAQAAGLGWRGISGLLITPKYGPCVRLAAVFVEIENLPMYEGNEHAWVLDFCEECCRCIRECPPGAFLDEPVQHENGLITVLDNSKCLPYFAKYHGCSICVKVCPFHIQSYEKIKEGFRSTIN